MNEPEPDNLLAAARDALRADPDRALKLYGKIINSGSGAAWACAHLDVAEHEYGLTRFAEAAEHARAILDAPPEHVDPGVRACAGILWCDVRETLELDLEETFLRQSIDLALAHGRKSSGAWGLMHLSRRQIRRGERYEGKVTLLRAVDLYDEAGSINAGPSALQYLATLELEDGNLNEARRQLDRGITHLKKFPLGGTLTRLLEKRLGELRDKIWPDNL